ncbi:response regulator [Enterovibrio nigricans]|uniref:Histidine kinase-like ATPase domain-containing protein n=1 Tax=Enterovibrio nigricans DSM 22720 TaxID=1121868 RepID=A0A1T4UUJ8_9GAMM|nr:response regulator [Enterovibrio nigricans]SKA56298.1 Histidine kinase-like ATPase domain-containing protein [Enterovibrio nigricans DSM 22720]
MVSIVKHECRPATLKNISIARNAIKSTLEKKNVPDSLMNKIQLCFSEAAANLVEHSTPQPTFISVNIECVDSSWQLHLEDDGQSWNPTLPDRVQSLDTFEEKEGGRGLALMHSLTDEMAYSIRPTFGANRLTLKWHIQKTKEKPRILIVDDDECQRRLYSAYLREQFNIVEADSGEQALEQLSNHDIDLVISDIRMPGMDGLTLKKALHKQTNTLITPFIFLTFADNAEIRSSAAGLGIDDYLIKPICKADLLNSANRVLKRSNQIYQQLTDKVNKRITNALSPSLPHSAHGWELAVANRNTGIGGGDVVLFRDNNDRMMVNLVDIMGHDVAAKFFSYAFGGYLRGLMYHVDDTPDPCSTLLSRLSDSALEDGLLSQVILTCCSTVLRKNGTIDIASAGHPAPFKVTQDGAELLDLGGILPGVVYGAEYETLSFNLAFGERMVFYTDGIFEAAVDDQSRKTLESKIIEKLEQTLDLPLQTAAEDIMHTFDLHGDRYRDDATIILIQRKHTDP